MSNIKFKACPSWSWHNEILPVEVERETDSSVWVRGRRQAKRVSGGDCYFDTWEDAHAALMVARQQDVEKARRALEQANSRLGNVKGMKPPRI